MLSPAADSLSPRDFSRLAEFIQGYSGIRMPPVKKTMVEGRLRRRVRALGLSSLSEYCSRLFEEGWLESEFVNLINVVTTNKTDFFREPEHFRLLAERVLPEWVAAGRGLDTPLKVWSAASSTGAEPYTLAMVLDDCARRNRGFRFKILATDISTDVLDKARHAVYPHEMIAPVPPEWQRRYFLRSRDTTQSIVRIVPQLRQSVHFGRLNLMDESYPVETGLDVVFCRNILIYFDKPTQQGVLQRLCDHLRPGGLLFVSHTETVTGMDLPIRQVAASVFARK
ncbi:MAG TPA: CheR family methyltransferase [Candidatus Omnitrophota bacterium]|nr:CheR family methyltransferase [Candidatus Omnitrophota bacterium]